MDGRNFTRPFEGLHDGNKNTPLLEPMQDFAGVWTLGYGSIFDARGVRVHEATAPITPEEAEALLLRDSTAAESAAVTLSAPTTLPYTWRVALGDFVFNMGSGRYKASTLRACVQRGDLDAALREFPKYRLAGGKIARGLVIRRQMEAELVTGALPLEEEAVRQRLAFLRRTLRL